MSKPSRGDVINAFADCRSLLAQYLQHATGNEAAGMIGMSPILNELQLRFEEATLRGSECECGAVGGASSHDDHCPALGKASSRS